MIDEYGQPILPHSIEAEQSVLGGLLLYQVTVDLQPDDFYKPEHREIFEAIQQIDNPDLIIVGDLVPQHRSYLIELAEIVPGETNLKEYARIVREHSIRRKLIQAGNTLAGNAYNAEISIQEAQSVHDQELSNITLVDSKEPAQINGVLKTAIKTMEALSESDGLPGLSTGFDLLDKRTTGFRPGDLVIIAARPGMGKTTLAMNMVESVIQKKSAVVFSLEMPADQLITRMLSSIGRIPYERIRTGKLWGDDWDKLGAATNILTDKPLHIDDSPGLTVQAMRQKCRKIQRQTDIGVIMVDYLQLMRAKAENKTQEISEISRSLKEIGKEIGCPVIALSQLNRSVESRPNKRPVMSDLRESGAIEQDADLIMFIYRDEVYNEDSPDKGIAEIITGKQRNGPIGTDRLAFVGQYSRFENLTNKEL